MSEYTGLHGRSPYEDIGVHGEHFVPDGWEDLDVGICPTCGRTIRWDFERQAWVNDPSLTVLVLKEAEIEEIRTAVTQPLAETITRMNEVNHGDYEWLTDLGDRMAEAVKEQLPNPIPPRIVRVRYCSERREGQPPRRAEVYVKVPYGGIHGMYALTEALTRAAQTRQVRWFQLTVPRTISSEVRGALTRWPEALAQTSQTTGVTWE